MIVGEPNEFAAEIHDRMPVFLAQEQFEPRLSGEAGARISETSAEITCNVGR
jgi:putative SOS response-associated peptidase YedK